MGILRHLGSHKLWKGHPASSSTDTHTDLKNLFLPTIMWLQTSQKVGFLKMCSWKMWALLFSGSCWALVGEDAWLSELGSCPVLVLTSGIKSTCSFTSLLVLWKKLSALLLRKLLVLKESDRFSFCSCNKKVSYNYCLFLFHSKAKLLVLGRAVDKWTCEPQVDLEPPEQ